MKLRESGCNQETAAAKAGFSERTGRRIEKQEHQPKKGQPRDWRTRSDPLTQIWDLELVPLLQREPELQPTTLFEYLQQKYPEQYPESIKRTLQRRVRQWKATSGPPKEVMFSQQHQPGILGLSDFTLFKQVQVTIKGKPFAHLLYHYRLAYSGWQYVQIVQGGESFVALASGLQNALWCCGGVPLQHRTDSLSAAYRNLGKATKEDLTRNYEAFCQHYQMRPTRNNPGQSHENGSIESAHGHFKRRLHQALLLRGSHEFDSIASYQQLIEEVVKRLNQNCTAKFEEEQLILRPLPIHRFPDYEVLSVRVTRMSTITVRCILYTVPSQLIGHRLTVHLFHDCLLLFLGRQQVLELPRVYVPTDSSLRRARSIDYRHVIDSLRRKPRAFLQSSWQQDLLPNDDYRRVWQQLIEQLAPDLACRLMVESLYIAAKQDCETAVASYLSQQLHQGTLTLTSLQERFSTFQQKQPYYPNVVQHSLHLYDQFLTYDPSQYHSRLDSSLFAQVSEVASHTPPMGNFGGSSHS